MESWMDGWKERMNECELFLPTPFPGAHLSFPELIDHFSGFQWQHQGEKQDSAGFQAFPGLREPNVPGGVMGKGVLLKQV